MLFFDISLFNILYRIFYIINDIFYVVVIKYRWNMTGSL